VNGSTATAFVATFVIMIVLFWVPTTERWLRLRERRRAMSPIPMSAERFERFERLSMSSVRVGAALITAIAGIKLLAEVT
jgi:hypothetical protein